MLNTDLLIDRISAKGMTHKEVADALSISKNTLTTILKRRKKVDTEQIDILCEILDIKDNDAKANIFLSKPSQIRDGLNNLS